MSVRTFRGGIAQVGSGLSITNGVTAEVRAMILAREEQDRQRRKAYRKKPKPRIGSTGDNFKEWDGRFGAILPSSH